MPIGPYPNFEACVLDQMRKGKSKAAAQRICGEIEKRSRGKQKMKDWRKLEFFVPILENFRDLNGDEFLIRGVAISETTTRNNVRYLAEELEKAAPTLRDKPILKDHINSVDSIVGRTTQNVMYDSLDRNIKFEARITDKEIQEKIKRGDIKNVSIGAHVKEIEESTDSDERVITVKGIDFVELSLVAVPADPNAGFTAAVQESLKLKREMESAEEEEESNDGVEEAVWSTKFVNNLPDAAFAVILPGGKKDEEGKTKPRSLRKLPHHGMNVRTGREHDTVDLPHLRNALARLPQADIPPALRAKARAHLEAHAKALKIGGRGEMVDDENIQTVQDENSNNEKENKEDEEVKMETEKLRKELEEKDNKLKELQEKLQKIEEEKLNSLKEEYKQLVTELKVTPSDVSNASEETLKILIENLKSIKKVKEEAETETETEPEVKDETKGKVSTGDESENDEGNGETESEEVIEESELMRGIGFWKPIEKLSKEKYKRLTR